MLSNTSAPHEGRPRSRSFSSTPTFSSDLAKLRAACQNVTNNDTPDEGNGNNCNAANTVTSYSRAIEIASTFDVLGCHSPLTRKVKLESEGDWIEFMTGSGCVAESASNENSINDLTTVALKIDLEKFLRYCFDIAYKMPPSPSTRAKNHVRSVSHSGIPVTTGAGRRGSPPELHI
ncbi:hypothetical protein HJC23_006291 [Cyclotella cryptica]|uniref:Uncharacterized protein n=1 Tax=Cyclotella cryptica TaxID=29204 RepID=A0ABD3P2U6_9STRA|eukprot:CCRYP_018135-RA/>CCRYP_018135-RA protein AED:0.02 eAED:-0.01 QI:0/-1/0/1/-1/1/1/0/175